MYINFFIACLLLDGCTGVNKPNILMYFPVQKHVTRIQLKARTGKKPIGSFYLYYMAWRQWIPYQVNGKIKVLHILFDVHMT